MRSNKRYIYKYLNLYKCIMTRTPYILTGITAAGLGLAGLFMQNGLNNGIRNNSEVIGANVSRINANSEAVGENRYCSAL